MVTAHRGKKRATGGIALLSSHVGRETAQNTKHNKREEEMNGIIPQRASIDNSDMTDGRAGYLFLPSLRTPFATELTRHAWLFSTTSGTTTVIATATKGAAARNARSSLLSTCVHRIDHMYVCARAWTHEKPSRQKWQVGFPVRCLKRYQTGARTGMIGTN